MTDNNVVEVSGLAPMIHQPTRQENIGLLDRL